ncbi:MAG TPA: TrmH family RNA methyltransferase [Clostridia bacterium]|nr:TrmH family RNA methyltransferase [Clostridia bacterium]
MNYQKKMNYSYSLGAYPTIELCTKKPEFVRVIYLHPKISSELKRKILSIAREHSLEYLESPTFFEKLEKENIYLAAKFTKFTSTLAQGNHLILHKPEMIGNLGTILRSSIAFGLRDIAIIDPSCDEYHPHCIRASMGAIFSLRIEHFSCTEDYMKKYPQNIYAFMTGEHTLLKKQTFKSPWSLLFGSESSGLPLVYQERFHPVKIKMSPDVDSLNLPLAVGLALYHLYE